MFVVKEGMEDIQSSSLHLRHISGTEFTDVDGTAYIIAGKGIDGFVVDSIVFSFMLDESSHTRCAVFTVPMYQILYGHSSITVHVMSGDHLGLNMLEYLPRLSSHIPALPATSCLKAM